MDSKYFWAAESESEVRFAIFYRETRNIRDFRDFSRFFAISRFIWLGNEIEQFCFLEMKDNIITVT